MADYTGKSIEELNKLLEEKIEENRDLEDLAGDPDIDDVISENKKEITIINDMLLEDKSSDIDEMMVNEPIPVVKEDVEPIQKEVDEEDDFDDIIDDIKIKQEASDDMFDEEKEDESQFEEDLSTNNMNISDEVFDLSDVIKNTSYESGGKTDEVIMIKIGGDKKYPYYIKKIDTTHMSMANNKDGVDLVVPSHILQHQGESYYDDVRSWLKGGTSPNGKSYDSDYYAKGGKIKEAIDFIKDDDKTKRSKKDFKWYLSGILDKKGENKTINEAIDYMKFDDRTKVSKADFKTYLLEILERERDYAKGGKLPKFSQWEKPITQKERDKMQETLVPLDNDELDRWIKFDRFKKTLTNKMEKLGVSEKSTFGTGMPGKWQKNYKPSEYDAFPYGYVEFTHKGKDYFVEGQYVFQSKNLKELLSYNDEQMSNRYAKGGKITGAGKSGLDKIKKTSKDNPSQMYKVTDDNYSNIGNFYLKNGKFAKMTVSNADYDFAYNKVSLRPKRDVIYKATEIEGKGGYFEKGGEIDYFEEYELLQKEYPKIYEVVFEQGELTDYNDTERLLNKLNSMGWTFDYGLDNSPYDLRPFAPKVNMPNYKDYAKGGMAEFCSKCGGEGEIEIKNHFDDGRGDYVWEDCDECDNSKGGEVYRVSGYWKDDGSEFNDYLISEYDDVPKGYDDDDIFYYGLSEDNLKNSSKDDILEFVITDYEPVSKNYAKGGEVDKLGKKKAFERVLKDSQFGNYKGMPTNEFKHNRLPKTAIIGKNSVSITSYTPNTKRYLDSQTFTSPKELAEYLDKNQIYAKGGETDDLGNPTDVAIVDKMEVFIEKEIPKLDENRYFTEGMKRKEAKKRFYEKYEYGAYNPKFSFDFESGGGIHNIEIYSDKLRRGYTVVIDGSVFEMNDNTMINMDLNSYIGERNEYPSDVSHWGEKISFDSLPMVVKDKITNRKSSSFSKGGEIELKYEVELIENATVNRKRMYVIVNKQNFDDLEKLKYAGGFKRFSMDLYTDDSQKSLTNVNEIESFLNSIGISPQLEFAEGGEIQDMIDGLNDMLNELPGDTDITNEIEMLKKLL
jgi:hypothetical protein